MAISDKLEYLNDTKQLLKDKINNLGGSIDDNTTFRQYANQLQNVYDNLPKTEYQEGTEINLGKTIKGKLDYDNGVVGIGQSEQESYEGYNLFDIDNSVVTPDTVKDTSKTSTGFNFTTNSTVGESAYGRIMVSTDFVSSDKTYGCSFDVTTNATKSIIGWMGSQKVSVQSITANTKTHIFVTFSGITTTTFSIGIYGPDKVTQIENFQIFEGNTDKTYEPYTGGQASPSPSYPQEIKCVTGNQDVVVSGKNELPFKFNSNTLNGITLTANDDGTIKINGTSTANTTLGGTSLATYTLKKGIYTYSIENALISGANITIWYGTNSTIKSLGTTTSVNFEVTEDTAYQWFRLSLYIPSGQTYNNVILKPMIRKSSITDDTYEPYKTPKTYQFSLGDYKFYGIGTYRDYILRTTGKNLINPSKYINAVVNNTSIGNTGILEAWATSWTTWIEMEANQTYVFSGNLSNVNSNVVRAFVTNSEAAIGTSVTRVDNLQNGGTYTNTSGYKYLVLEFLDVTTYGGNWQIEEGSTASDYQPYGVGNWYKVGNVYKRVFDGTENNWTYNAVTQGSLFRYNKILNNKRDTTIVNYSNYYKGIPTTEITNRANNQFYIQTSEISSGYLDVIDNRYTSASDFKTWLTTHNLEVYYVLDIPEITPITGTLAEQLEEWWNGQSLDGTTIIEGNGDLPLIIKCRGLKGE